MTSRHTAALLALASLVAGTPAAATAQIRASERGSVSQTVDGTTIAVDYSRPQVRGRDTIFGGLEPWGKVWTPGANWATTIDVSHDVTINGHALAAGKYSLWLEIQEMEWTAIFDPEPRRFHLMPPPVAENQVRFPVRPGRGEPVEVLSWSFPAVRATGATLQLAWSTTTVTFDIGVHPSRTVTVAEDFAARYVGSYRMSLRPPLGERDVAFDVSYEDDRLVARWESPPVPLLGEVWMVHLGEGMFVPAMLEKGEVFDLLMDLVFEFTPLDGRATGFELRALGDALWAAAERRQPMSFFITSTGPGYGADLSGLAGADRQCRVLAEAVGAGDLTWRAYLSTITGNGQAAVHARDRIGTGPWYNVNAVKIADDVTDLHSENANLTKQTILTEKGDTVNGRGDRPNMHDILTGSNLDGTAFTGDGYTNCDNWTSRGDGSTRVGHHDRTGGGQNPSSWNSAHNSRGCSQQNLQGTGGNGLFYCFGVPR